MLTLSRSNPKEYKGQAILIIILVMAVVLTIGLSIASRSTTDIKISQQTEESARAFSAAEAGVESALVAVGATTVTGSFTTEASFESSSTPFGSGTQFAFPGEYGIDETLTVWLADHTTLAKQFDRKLLKVVWGKPGTVIDKNTPALEVIIYYKDGTEYKVGRYAIDPVPANTNDRGDNKFCHLDNTNCTSPLITSFSDNRDSGEKVHNKLFRFGAVLNLENAGFWGANKTLIFTRLRALYTGDDQIFGVMTPEGAGGSGEFPDQGTKIESVGQAGNATRRVEVSRLYPAPPSIFDFVVYSGTSLTK
jgi:hypothetical protein